MTKFRENILVRHDLSYILAYNKPVTIFVFSFLVIRIHIWLVAVWAVIQLSGGDGLEKEKVLQQ